MANGKKSKPPFRFEKLNVWQNARQMNRAIYELTRGFPAEERFVMTSQLRRAGLSICSNIAEGSGRNSEKDFGHYLEIAYGSTMEVASDVILAADVNLIAEARREELLDNLNAIAGQLVTLNRSLQIPETKTPFSRAPRNSQRPSTLDPRPSTLDSSYES